MSATTLSVTVRIGITTQTQVVPANARFTDLLDLLGLPRESIVINLADGEMIRNNREFIVDYAPGLSFQIVPADDDVGRRVVVFFENQQERVFVGLDWRVRDLIVAAVDELGLARDQDYLLLDEADGPALDPDARLFRRDSRGCRDRDFYLVSYQAWIWMTWIALGFVFLILIIVILVAVLR